jgi:hypothetical protein
MSSCSDVLGSVSGIHRCSNLEQSNLILITYIVDVRLSNSNIRYTPAEVTEQNTLHDSIGSWVPLGVFQVDFNLK